MLREIGQGAYGTRYAFKGAFPFNAPDFSNLKWGDSIRDSDGRGMTMSVNVCCECGGKYLASTIILVPNRGPCCDRKGGAR